MERHDLRWLCEDGCGDPKHFDPVTDADLASLGYVKLADVCLTHGAGRLGVHLEQCEYFGPMQVMPCRFAAIEGEATDET